MSSSTAVASSARVGTPSAKGMGETTPAAPRPAVATSMTRAPVVAKMPRSAAESVGLARSVSSPSPA